MSGRLQLVGSRFGRLVVVADAGNNNRGRALWSCVCDCGAVTLVSGATLRRGTQSCGCKKADVTRARSRTHGMSRHQEYWVYKAAKDRCNNPKNRGYVNYGGRGIRFLFASFEQFYAELGPRPAGMSLDRIDNDGNYEPRNVRWADRATQNRNKRLSVRNKSGFRGVYWHRQNRRWQVQLKIGGHIKYLGCYATTLEAARVYNRAAADLDPDAHLNVM